MKKLLNVSTVSYILGLLILPLGVALMERADFGVSMIVAPAYVVYRFLSALLPWFTFGTAEYLLQALLLVALMLILRKFRVSYLFSFVTVLIYGVILDLWMMPMQCVPVDELWVRILLYVVGLVISSLGVAFFFHTNIPPEVYELFVKEVSLQKNIPLTKFKTFYDCCSCAAGVILSFALFGFGQFVGVNWGTVVAAVINGWIIGRCSALIDWVIAGRQKNAG